jgi:alpha-L-fucosidase
MNRPLILAFGYEARSGKGECCSTIHLQHSLEHGGRFDIFRISFAQRLRDEVHEAMATHWNAHYPGRPMHNKDDQQFAMKLVCEWAGVEYDPDPLVDELNPYGKQRQLTQWWGTEYRRAQNTDYWLNYVVDQIRIVAPEIVLIDDMRFPNEFDWITAVGGKTVKTTRLGMKPIQNGLANHPSESAIANKPFDYYITARDGQLPWLRSQALHLFDFITR